MRQVPSIIVYGIYIHFSARGIKSAAASLAAIIPGLAEENLPFAAEARAFKAENLALVNDFLLLVNHFLPLVNDFPLLVDDFLSLVNYFPKYVCLRKVAEKQPEVGRWWKGGVGNLLRVVFGMRCEDALLTLNEPDLAQTILLS